jgi:hypothetical protein
VIAVMASNHPVSHLELRSFLYIKSTLKASLSGAALFIAQPTRVDYVYDSEDSYV